jgi:hypothetical protein
MSRSAGRAEYFRIVRVAVAGVLFVALGAACSSGGAGTDAGSGSPTTDAMNDAMNMDATPPVDDGPPGDAAGSCPAPQSLAECPVASGGLCVVEDDPYSGCATNALPSGLACSGPQQCSMPVLPCAGEIQSGAGAGRVDGYVCSCVDGLWSCDDCYVGEGACVDAGPPGDGGTGGEVDGGLGTDGGFVAGISLANANACLAEVLPTSDSGTTTCSIVITGLTDGCLAAGLSPATPQQIGAIARKGPYPAGSACALNQLAGSADAPGCSDPESTGWCYVQGSCLGDAGPDCQHAICTTSAFHVGYYPTTFDSGAVTTSWVGYLVCP